MPNKINVVIDPVIKQKTVKIPKDMQIRGIVCLSLMRGEISFRVTVRGEVLPKSITLKSIRIEPINRKGIEETRGAEYKIDNIQNGIDTITKSFNHIFPFSDAFWIQAEVEDIPGFEIETIQILPNNSEGRGWSSPDNKRKWSNYVIAIDRFVFEQKKVNFWLWFLTWVLVALGLIQLIGFVYDIVKSCR
jgi:hypothetical protein